MLLMHILILTIFISCSQDPLLNPFKHGNNTGESENNNYAVLKLVWRKFLMSDSVISYSKPYCIWRDNVVYGVHIVENGEIVFMDKNVGEKNKIWDKINNFSEIEYARLYKGSLYLSNAHRIIKFITSARLKDLYSFNLITEGGPQSEGFSFFGQYLYITSFDYDEFYNPDFVRVNQVDINSGNREIVYQLNTISTFGEKRRTFLTRPAIWVDKSGDKNLLQFYSSIPQGESLTVGSAFLYNMADDTMVWYIKNFNPHGELHSGGPVIYKDRAYIVSKDSIHCIDIATGKRIWSHDDFNSLFGGYGFHAHLIDLEIVDGRLYFIDGAGFTCIDAITGKVIYNRDEDDYGDDNSDLTYFDGVFYYTSSGIGRLCAVRASDGELLLKKKSPYQGNPLYPGNNFTDNGVVIDPETRLLYTCDYYFAMCFKIPEGFGK